MERSKCEGNIRLSHRSHKCEVNLCGERFGKEQQLKDHVRKVHPAGFVSKGGDNPIKITNNNLLNLEKVEDLDDKDIETSKGLDNEEIETSEDLDDEEILDKFNKLAIFDPTSFAAKKESFLKLSRNLFKNDLKQEGLTMDWIKSERAIQRMKTIMSGKFDSRRHNLFFERYYINKDKTKRREPEQCFGLFCSSFCRLIFLEFCIFF